MPMCREICLKSRFENRQTSLSCAAGCSGSRSIYTVTRASTYVRTYNYTYTRIIIRTPSSSS